MRVKSTMNRVKSTMNYVKHRQDAIRRTPLSRPLAIPKKSYREVTFRPESFALTHNIPHVTMPIAPRQRSLKVRLTGSPAINEDTFPGLIDVRRAIVYMRGVECFAGL